MKFWANRMKKNQKLWSDKYSGILGTATMPHERRCRLKDVSP